MSIHPRSSVMLIHSSPDNKKAIYPFLGKIEIVIFAGVFNTALSRVKISLYTLSLTVTEIPEVG